MTERETEAYRLRYAEGMTYRAIATELGVDVHTSHEAVKRAEKVMGEHARSLLPAKTRELDRIEAMMGEIEALGGPDLDTAATVKLVKRRRVEALVALDMFVMSRASASQLTQTISGLTNTAQLLEGQPTAILRYDDIRKIDELAVAIKDEIERRQRLVDVTPEPTGEAAQPA